MALSRRDLVKKSVLGGAAVWVSPTVLSSRAAAQGTPRVGGVLYGCDFLSRTTYRVDRNSGLWAMVGATLTQAPAGMAFIP